MLLRVDNNEGEDVKNLKVFLQGSLGGEVSRWKQNQKSRQSLDVENIKKNYT